MIGGSLFFIAVGAILAFAVKGHAAHIDLRTVGYILMGVSALALIIGLVQQFSNSRRLPPGEPPPPGM